MGYTKDDFRRLDQICIIGEGALAALSYSFNASVIYLFWRFNSKTRQKLSNSIFFIQAVADLFVSLALALGAATKQSRGMSKDLMYAWIFFLEYSQSLSISTLFIISMDRYLAVRFPFIHRSYITISKGVVVSFITFFISSVPAFVSVFHILPKRLMLQLKYQITMGTITLLILLFIFMVLFASYQSVRSSFKLRIKHHLSSSFNQKVKISGEKRKERRVIKILFSMCFVYTVTYIPFALVKICHGVFTENGVPLFIQNIIARSLAFLYYTTACFNPLITLFFKEDYFNALYSYYDAVTKKVRHSNLQKSLMSGQSLETNF